MLYPSSEPSRRDGSDEGSQHMVSMRNTKIIIKYSLLSRALFNTVMCLRIGTPKIIHFPFVPNGKLIVFSCPRIQAYYSIIMMCLNIGASKIH